MYENVNVTFYKILPNYLPRAMDETVNIGTSNDQGSWRLFDMDMSNGWRVSKI
jgi:hypothetical protein